MGTCNWRKLRYARVGKGLRSLVFEGPLFLPRYLVLPAIYGAKTDIVNAQKILGYAGYNYIQTDIKGFDRPTFNSNDIILGGVKTKGGIPDNNINNATRLAGDTTELTADAIRNYAVSKNVYGAKTDIDNAKRILGTTGFNYIQTDLTGFVRPTFTSNDIILGGKKTGGGIPDDNINDATRLQGENPDLTEMRIRDYAHTPDIANGKYGMINRDPASMYVSIVNDTTGAKINIPKDTKLQIYSSSGDYYDCYYPGTTGVRVLKAYLTPTTPDVTPPVTPSSELGVLSAKYESNGDPGIISNTPGDPGGKSYGAWQLASKIGSVDVFMNWLKGVNANYYNQLKDAKNNDGNKFGSNFDSTWKQLAKNDKNGFLQIQHDFIKYSYYDVAAKDIKNRYGFDVSTKSFALQNVLWSTAVQHGQYYSGGGAPYIFGKVNLNGTDKEIITAIYNERSRVDAYFPGCSQQVKNSLINRFKSEKVDALNMLK